MSTEDPLKVTPACELDRDNRVNKLSSTAPRFIEIHTAEEIAEEVERMRGSPEMRWWLGLLHGEWGLRNFGDEIFRTEAYNRLTKRLIAR